MTLEQSEDLRKALLVELTEVRALEFATRDENEHLRTLNAELMEALEPFAVEDKVSLIDTLGHINREHLAKARVAFAQAKSEA